MNLKELTDNLNNDLMNEYKHWHFYINAGIRVQGFHRPEIREFLLSQAESEMKHITQFGDFILGLGGTPTVMPAPFNKDAYDVETILKCALDMEQEVLNNFLERMDQAEELGGVSGKRTVIFLEDQMNDTGKDVDELMQLLSQRR